MPGLLETLFADDTATIEQVRQHTGDPQRAEQAYGAAVGTLLRGLEAKSKTTQGAEGLWDKLSKFARQGHIPQDSPARQGVEVRDMEPKAAREMLKTIFGKDAAKVEGGFSKVVKLDPEATQQIFAKVLPVVLGTVFGAAKRADEEDPEALPKVVRDARKEVEQRQPKTAGIFAAIFDQDHDGDVDLTDLAGIFLRKPK
ncbi:DUF937 domain-containing protein [Aeoliella sp. ICT_H6.2]|uniref:DUF937 domain-containing protein n=1 Tax=Aeoliella straminimaris TaxID=2954799 RepID=A0A9X2JGR4_9BACT|nr:DUF937 domain-containing protein [Aeoliella straminimaris]MCO6045280.1 DUF937 domain-containing protein [Aeoliella straminimaris]